MQKLQNWQTEQLCIKGFRLKFVRQAGRWLTVLSLSTARASGVDERWAYFGIGLPIVHHPLWVWATKLSRANVSHQGG